MLGITRGLRTKIGWAKRHPRRCLGSKGYDWYHNYQAELEAKRAAGVPSTSLPQAYGPRHRASFDVAIGGEAAGTITFELLSDLLPVTTENFVRLCRGEDGLGYAGTLFHEIRKDCLIIGGDVEMLEGRGGHANLPSGERYFDDEAFVARHSTKGVISMSNSGVDRNSSQFFVTLKPCPWLDGRNVVVGEAIDGVEVLDTINELFCVRQRPLTPVTIQACTVIEATA